MRRIDDVFTVHRARSGISSEYEPGSIPFIGNGFGDNAVMAFVTPRPADKVFSFTGIAVSAFCEATVQAPPFVANGRAGNGLLVLEPKSPMSSGQLAYVAAYINSALRWNSRGIGKPPKNELVAWVYLTNCRISILTLRPRCRTQ